MDLEKLKYEWKNNETFRKTIKDEMICEILANQNKGALNTIKRYEKEALTISPIYVLAFELINIPVILKGGLGMIWSLALIPIGALLWYWSYYLCKFLDKIDMANMNVTEVSKYILKYKQYLVRHTIGAVIFMPIYLFGALYFLYASKVEEHVTTQGFMNTIIIILILFSLIIFGIIIWHRYFKHVREIQNNLKELKEFEEEAENSDE